MRQPPHQGERLEGQHGHHLPTEVRPDHVDHGNHQKPDDYVTLERREGHFLAQGLELCLSGCDLLLVAFVLSLDDVGVLELLQLLVEFLDFHCS